MAVRTPLRVLYLDHTAELGGGEIALLELCRALDKSLVCPIVVLAQDGPLREQMDEASIEVYIQPLGEIAKSKKDSLGVSSLLKVGLILGLLQHIFRLAKWIRANAIDVVHTNSLKSDIYGGFAGRIARKRVIWHIRDRIEKPYLPPVAVRLFRQLCRWVPNVVVGNSQATLSTLNLPATKPTAVLYSGVNAEALKIADHEPFFGEQVLIGLVGRITPWKGQHIFLQAAASVAKSNPNVQFQIIGGALFGEEAYEVEMKELAKSLGIADQVEFTGHRKDIAGMMRNLDILVHASTSAEPFGQVIVQGMAAGRAVIATDGGGVPEIIVQGQTGLLVPMGDVEAIVVAIERLIHDPELGRRMGLAASERASQHFSIEATARKAEGLYLGL